jgi:hypothetical protein
MTTLVTDPVVRRLIDAIDLGDRDMFFELLTSDATMSDDGTDRDLVERADRGIFSARGHMDVESATDGGRALIADYRNDTWGAMRTTWRFTVDGDRISRFETGQA